MLVLRQLVAPGAWREPPQSNACSTRSEAFRQASTVAFGSSPRRKSLNAVTLEGKLAGAGLSGVPHRDLSDIAESWIADADVGAALDVKRCVEPEMWS